MREFATACRRRRNEPRPRPYLDRRTGLLQATSTNILGMVGVGPFLTIPFMIAAMNGPHILYAWIAGAVLSVADGLVYAHLGAALPGSGGPYLYLREAYRPFGLGRLMGFVFIFQILLVAPLSIAGGAVGSPTTWVFSGRRSERPPTTGSPPRPLLGVPALLYRDIESIGRLSVVMLGALLLTTGWVIVAGLFRSRPRRPSTPSLPQRHSAALHHLGLSPAGASVARPVDLHLRDGAARGIVFSFAFLALAVACHFSFEKWRNPPRGDAEGGDPSVRYA